MGHTQMKLDFRVLWNLSGALLDGSERAGEFTFMKQYPSESVCRERVIGLEAARFFSQRVGLIDVVEVFGVQIRKVIKRGDIVRLYLKQPIIGGTRVIEMLELLLD